MNKDNRRLREYIISVLPKVEKKATGHLHRPFLAVSYGKYYADAVFSWDNYHMAARLAEAGKPEYFRYHLENSLEYQQSDGLVPCVVTADSGPWFPDPVFPAQPFVMQGSLQYLVRSGDLEWGKRQWKKLEKYLTYWEKNHFDVEYGLFFWPVGWMGGFDNDAATTFFEPGAVISPDINSWFFLEYSSAGAIAGRLGHIEAAKQYYAKAAALRKAINTRLWLESELTYASIHRKKNVHVFSWGDFSGDRSIGHAAFQSCSNLIPLYTRIAPQDRAECMIEKYILNPKHFWSKWGLRSLSKSSNYYNNAVWGNPPRLSDPERLTNSNWQGPVWIPICYFGFHLLRYYGYQKEARLLMNNVHRLLCHSLDTVGSFAENYHAEDGTPLYCTEFASWNLLADLMPSELTGATAMDPVWNALR